jgi:hypothetical protein
MDTFEVIPEFKQSTTEIALDIIAFGSICIKCGFDEALMNQRLFVEMVNEAGFRTSRGEEFTYMGFRQMMARLDPVLKKKVVEECTSPTYSEVLIGHDEIETYDE